MTSAAKHAEVRQLLRQEAQKTGLCSHLQLGFLLLPASHLSCLSLPIDLMGVRLSARYS